MRVFLTVWCLLPNHHNPKQEIQSKAKQWSLIRHPNIIRVHQLYDHEGLDLRIEFCANGTASQVRPI
jgi:hypothetical protein